MLPNSVGMGDISVQPAPDPYVSRAEDHDNDACVTSELACEAETTAAGGASMEHALISKFSFELPRGCRPDLLASAGEPGVVVDEDGDPVLDRKHPRCFHLEIENRVHTPLSLVGEQVWRGALLLSDFILTQHEIFSGKTVLEMGAGTGITSVVAAMVADRVICTDVDRGDILGLCRRNLQRNSKVKEHGADVRVESLDWCDVSSWSDRKGCEDADVIIAADVVYHEALTEAFLSALELLWTSGKPKRAYIALEKRYVFTVEDLDTVAPMFAHFMESAVQRPIWKVETLPIDFQQCFAYGRTKELVLVKIS